MGPCAAACARSYFNECSAVPWKMQLNPSTGGLLPVVFQSFGAKSFWSEFRSKWCFGYGAQTILFKQDHVNYCNFHLNLLNTD